MNATLHLSSANFKIDVIFTPFFPLTETVDMLEDLLIEFITETTHKCMEIGRTGRIQVEDIIFLVRKDPKKYSRVKELLTMNEELKKARKAFDEQKY